MTFTKAQACDLLIATLRLLAKWADQIESSGVSENNRALCASIREVVADQIEIVEGIAGMR